MGDKIENFFFVSFDLKMILMVFSMSFKDFWFSRSPSPSGRTPAGEAYFAAIVSDYMTSREAFYHTPDF